MFSRNLLCLVLCAVCLLTSMPVVATAAEVNKNLASNPAAALNEIDSMSLPVMPDQLASELRGTGFTNDVFGTILAISISYKVSYSALAKSLWDVKNYYGWSWFAATSGAKAFGWELGRFLALRDGLPDPGPFYAPKNAGMFAPWYAQVGYNIVQRYR